MKVQHMLPEDIERTSMDMISRKLYERGIVLPEEHAAVVKRVIHTTADFDFARNLHFTPNAVGLAKAALFRGVAIVTDTNMAKAGISKSALAKLGGQVCCFMADEDVAQTAKEKGTTRAVAAMEKAVPFMVPSRSKMVPDISFREVDNSCPLIKGVGTTGQDPTQIILLSIK